MVDPSFHIPARIDILLGADCFWNLLCVGQIKIGKEQLTLQKTKLGWLAAGLLMTQPTNVVRYNLSKCVDISEQIAKFWELEEGFNQRVFSQEEKECESHFSSTHRRDKGRFVVKIPLKKDSCALGESYGKALKRLVNLETRLRKDSTIREQYITFLQEYKELDHMRRIESNQINKSAYYLPHHCVIRDESLTIKIRVVFDASAATDNGVLLNDIQMVGPTL